MMRRNKFLLGCLLALAIGFGATVLLAESASGTLKTVSSKSLDVTVTQKDSAGNEVQKDMKFSVGKKSTITRDGKKATVKDLKTGDQVKITYDEKRSKKDDSTKRNAASRIEATSK